MDLLEGSKSDNNLSALIHKINGNVHKVVLYNHTSRGEVCINRKLISLGLATTLDPATCIFHKRNARKPYPIQAPIQMNIRTVSITCLVLRSLVLILFYTQNKPHNKNARI